MSTFFMRLFCTPTAGLVWMLLVGVLGGCEQLLVNNLNQVNTEVALNGELHTRSLAVIASPALFEAFGERAAILKAGAWEEWAWSGGAVGGPLPDGAEVSVGPLEATFKRQHISVVPFEGGGGLRAVFRYRAALVPVRLLYRDSAGGTQLCKLDLDLRQRELTLDLVPSVGPQGQPVWNVGANNGLTGDEPLTYTVAEDCTLDVSVFDWGALSSQVTGLLSAHVQAEVVPGLREGLVALLGLPAGSVSLVRAGGEFFAQQPMTLTSTVSASGPWNGAPFDVSAAGWLRLSLDVGLPAANAFDVPQADGSTTTAPRCASPLLNPPNPAVTPLIPLEIPTTTPTLGEPYHMLWWVEEGVWGRFFTRLVSAGSLCADLSPVAQDLSTFSLLLLPVSGLGDVVRLRVQPLEHLTVEAVAPKTLRLRGALRLEVYGTYEGTLLRWASLDVALQTELLPSPDPEHGMRFEVLALTTQLRGADTTIIQSLNPSALSLEKLTNGLIGYLIEHHLRWPLVRAFDQRFEVVEVAVQDGRVAIYLRLIPLE